MVVTAFPSSSAAWPDSDPPGEEPGAAREDHPHEGAVRILRTPEELSEAITRAREFERRNTEVMRARARRYEDVIALQEPDSDPSSP